MFWRVAILKKIWLNQTRPTEGTTRAVSMNCMCLDAMVSQAKMMTDNDNQHLNCMCYGVQA